MAEGFLLYQKRKFLKIAVAVGMMVGSLALSFMFSDISMLLFMLILVIGIILLFSVKLTDNPYRKLWKEPLLFDKLVKAELNTTYAEKKKFLQPVSYTHLFPLPLPGGRLREPDGSWPDCWRRFYDPPGNRGCIPLCLKAECKNRSRG